ncbi:MAG: cobyric acid synthase [Planctomycetota bacterium]
MRTLMIQGTASDAGKSVLVAGLCRLAARRGIRVAPFKSQNMSLNAAVTSDGLEIGRAQALQALACGLTPTVHMNPILLKPEAESRSQVVLLGKAVARVDFREYADYRQRCIEAIDGSLAVLGENADLVIAEGAGSPAEINLMARDIANMFVARRTDAEVWLVGDIDRGGVFAALYGTVELLPPEDRRRVRAFVMNRFRGDVELLRPGLRMLEDRTGVPTIGVVPFLTDLGLPAEDGQSIQIRNRAGGGEDGPPKQQVVVVRYPRISNYDDFLPLESDPRVELRYVDDPAAIADAELVILPGSKATRADLAWVRSRGIDAAVLEHAARGGRVLGICGGYQMLGARIVDASGVEGRPGTSTGLGLLPVETHFESTKEVRPVEVRATGAPSWVTERCGDGVTVTGYEIHAGRVVPTRGDARWLFQHVGGASAPEGVVDGNVAGTLVHALFDSPEVRGAVLGLPVRDRVWTGELEAALDRLADHLEESLEEEALARAFGG